ncbi:hypothetical protein [Janthinobacterium svalbardensis]|uniref:hypothetical protein n=1 Tax=Janthinobacterium svalbardensis TaxID=368607 RepID=UPI0012FE3AD4|nr:hypothetical protein [Janthinobacterium svalbardensis]
MKACSPKREQAFYFLYIKMDIYENIVIGNFLYGLGLAMGGAYQTRQLPLSVNLLQQTPLDRGAGDVLVRGSCVMRLLEFKRSANDDDKEESKLIHLQRSLSNSVNSDLIPVSREVHWFIRSRSECGNLDLQISPYLDFNKIVESKINFGEFIGEMVKEAIGATDDRSAIFSRYLRILAESQGSIKGSSGGLIVSVDDSGLIKYVVVEDLREIGLKLDRLQEIYRQRQLERQQQYEKQWTRSLPGIQRDGHSR